MLQLLFLSVLLFFCELLGANKFHECYVVEGCISLLNFGYIFGHSENARIIDL